MKNTPTEDELKTGVTYTVYLGGDQTSSPVKSTILVKTKEDNTTPEYTLGDVTGDGVIDWEDAYVIDLYSVEYFDRIISEGYDKFWDDDDESVALSRGDVTKDESLDWEDAYVIDLYSVEYFDRITSEGYPEFWK